MSNKIDEIKIFKQAKEIAIDENTLFIQDIIDSLPIGKTSFYKYFPDGSNELNELNEIIDKNRVSIKKSLRAKWHKSDNATLQMALYKLTCSPEEHKLLQQNYVDHTTKGESINKLSKEEALEKSKDLDNEY